MLRELTQIINHLEDKRLGLEKAILKKEEEPEQPTLDEALSGEGQEGETVRLERVG